MTSVPKTLIVDCKEMFYADVTGAAALRSLKTYANRYDVEISLARLHARARKTLTDDGILAETGEGNICDTVRSRHGRELPGFGECC